MFTHVPHQNTFHLEHLKEQSQFTDKLNYLKLLLILTLGQTSQLYSAVFSMLGSAVSTIVCCKKNIPSIYQNHYESLNSSHKIYLNWGPMLTHVIHQKTFHLEHLKEQSQFTFKLNYLKFLLILTLEQTSQLYSAVFSMPGSAFFSLMCCTQNIL